MFGTWEFIIMSSLLLYMLDVFPYWKDKLKSSQRNLRRGMYMYLYISPKAVHALQTSLIFGWAVVESFVWRAQGLCPHFLLSLLSLCWLSWKPAHWLLTGWFAVSATAGAGISMQLQIRVTGHAKMGGKPLDAGKLVPAVPRCHLHSQRITDDWGWGVMHTVLNV